MTYTLKSGLGKLEAFLREEIKYPGLTRNYSNSRTEYQQTQGDCYYKITNW